ncbi:MAG TPA: DUF58 domain-containing protein [Bacillales bacterium]|nr:DUF58 domain-containing protein [Bacillales bacterium]
MTKSLKNLWARFLFRDRGILPTKRMLALFAFFSCAVVFLTLAGATPTSVILVNAVFFGVSFADLFLSPKKNQFLFKRTMPERMERGFVYSIQLSVSNDSSHACELRFLDGLPQSFETHFPMTAVVRKRTTAVVSYETKAPVRGKYVIEKLYVRYKGFLGLWEKQTTAELFNEVKVIPDLTETKQYLADPQRFLTEEGVSIRKRKKGEGEFSLVRTYVVGDDPRKINWRQTAKKHEIMMNEFEPEHGKQLTVMIDCGRMMGAELEKGNRLEKALEAAMTISAAALKNGDAVSVLAFSKDIKRYVPPAKGVDHLQKILEAIYDLEVDEAESNYPAVLHYVQTHQKKRSLLLLFSDVSTFLHEESGLLYLKRLRRRHLFVLVGIEDETLAAMTKLYPENVWKSMVKSIAQQQRQLIKKRKTNWQKQGLIMAEAKEEGLAAAAVSHYVHIMNQGLL